LAVTASFEIKDSYYMNKKTREDEDKFFYWDPKKGFMLINKVIKKQPPSKRYELFSIFELDGSNFGLYGR